MSGRNFNSYGATSRQNCDRAVHIHFSVSFSEVEAIWILILIC
jgi:hypothetical protein